MQSRLCNPVLANLLRDVPGYVEQIGSGTRFMLDETKRMGLPAPEFQEMAKFVVTFCRSPSLAPPQPQAQTQYRETLWEEDEWLRGAMPVANLPHEQESRLVKTVQYVNEHGFITNSIYRKLTRVSGRTASRDLEMLVQHGRPLPS